MHTYDQPPLTGRSRTYTACSPPHGGRSQSSCPRRAAARPAERLGPLLEEQRLAPPAVHAKRVLVILDLLEQDVASPHALSGLVVHPLPGYELQLPCIVDECRR